jgi:hypothetical protein
VERDLIRTRTAEARSRAKARGVKGGRRVEILRKIQSALAPLGLPAGAFAFAYFLVLGAKLYEQDARRERLKDVADLMNSGSVTNFGKLVATLVPQIFERIFGSKPFSWKFISRSCLATTIFWIILL